MLGNNTNRPLDDTYVVLAKNIRHIYISNLIGNVVFLYNFSYKTHISKAKHKTNELKTVVYILFLWWSVL